MNSPEYGGGKNQNVYSKIKKIAALGAVMVASQLINGGRDERAGEIVSQDPVIETNEVIDNTQTTVTWNIKGNVDLEAIGAIDTDYDVDVFAFTEVSYQDYLELTDNFPAWYFKAVIADLDVDKQEGGRLNVLMSRQEQTDSEAYVYEGKSEPLPTIAGELYADVKALDFFSMERTRRVANPEDRVSLFSTIQIDTPDGIKDFRIGTVHLTPHFPMHAEQIRQFKQDFGQNISEGGLAEVCGDTNSSYAEMREIFPAKEGYAVPLTGPTFRNMVDTLDFCVSANDGMLVDSETEVLYGYNQSDHFPLISSMTIYDGQRCYDRLKLLQYFSWLSCIYSAGGTAMAGHGQSKAR